MSYKPWIDEPFYWAPTKKISGGWIAHFSSPKAPPAPDYEGAAERTAAGNLEAIKYQTIANRVNQHNPWGSQTWTSTPSRTFDDGRYQDALEEYNKQASQHASRARQVADTSWMDNPSAATPVNYGPGPLAPNRDDFYKDGPDSWTQTTSLTPDAQKALDAQLAIQNSRSAQAQSLLGQVENAYRDPLDMSGLIQAPTSAPTLDLSGVQGLNQNAPTYNGVAAQTVGAYEGPEYGTAPQWDTAARDQAQAAAYGMGRSMLDPQFQQQEDQLRNRLALQGLTPTSEAFDQSVGNFNRSRNDAYGNLANQSILTGNQTGINDYNARLAGFNSDWQNRLQGSNQTFQNNLAGTGMNNAALQGAANQTFQNKMSGYNAQNDTRTQALQNTLQSYGAAMAGVSQQQNLSQQQLAAKLAQRDIPLNQLNALLTGQQVQSPSFGGYSQQGNAGGADYMGALQGQSQFNQGIYNAEAASAAGNNSALASVAGAAAMFMF